MFANRRMAGQQLAEAVRKEVSGPGVVFGLPRGGVPVAFEVARALNAPLEVMVTRKVGAPFNPELAVGAVAPDGLRVWNESLVRQLGLSEAYLNNAAHHAEQELARRLALYRGNRPWPDVAGKTAIVVDDGLATGATARVALRAIRKWQPAKLVLAVPVASPDTLRSFRTEADQLIAVETPVDLMAVGLWYRDFSQTSDEEVLSLLAQSRQQPLQPAIRPLGFDGEPTP